jgi:hypothetical protein
MRQPRGISQVKCELEPDTMMTVIFFFLFAMNPSNNSIALWNVNFLRIAFLFYSALYP